MNEQAIKLAHRIGNETYHARKVIESCQTNEQLDNANQWCCQLIDIWWHIKENMCNHMSLSASLSFSFDYIESAANVLTKFINIQRKIIKNMNK